ncbi:MAG: replication-associated recombination protein A, partial [Candidatus Saganbacteria bacterium]|nr:replication-associated recombination protein A [Candidatus Saganbacteria bacterium]
PKSNAAYLGIDAALKDVKENPTLAVPKHLQNAVYEGEKKLGKGKDYKYAHNHKGGYVAQEYLTAKRKYYEPKDIGFEKKIKARMEELRKVI